MIEAIGYLILILFLSPFIAAAVVGIGFLLLGVYAVVIGFIKGFGIVK